MAGGMGAKCVDSFSARLSSKEKTEYCLEKETELSVFSLLYSLPFLF